MRRPGSLAGELYGSVTDPRAQPRLLGFTLLFALLFLFIYVAVYIFAKLTRPRRAGVRATSAAAAGWLAARARVLTLAGMTAGNIPRLIETLKVQAGDEKHLACTDAFKIARDLDVPLDRRRPHLQRAGHQDHAVPARLLLTGLGDLPRAIRARRRLRRHAAAAPRAVLPLSQQG